MQYRFLWFVSTCNNDFEANSTLLMSLWANIKFFPEPTSFSLSRPFFLYCCALWKDYSTSSFNMVKVAYNNVYRAFMGIKRVYGHSISSEYVNNCIDGFEATLKEN